MIYRIIVLLHVVTFLFCNLPAVHAQAIPTFDENSLPFLVASYEVPGAVSFTADSILFDVVPEGGVFAGVAGTLNLPGIDFAPNEYQWEVRFRLLPGNNVPGFVAAVYSDMDDGYLIDEAWVFYFDFDAHAGRRLGHTPTGIWHPSRRRNE